MPLRSDEMNVSRDSAQRTQNRVPLMTVHREIFRRSVLAAMLLAAIVAALAACGGGGSGSAIPNPGTSPMPGATLAPTSQETSVPLSTSATTSVNLGGVSNGGANVATAASITLPAVSSATNASIVLTATALATVPAPSARLRPVYRPDNLGVPTTPLLYFEITTSSTTTIASTPAFTVTFAAAQMGNCYVVSYNPLQASAGWQEVLGPVACGPSVSFPATTLSSPLTLSAGVQYVFVIVTTASTIATPTPTPTPAPTPAATPTSPVPTSTPTTPPATGASITQNVGFGMGAVVAVQAGNAPVGMTLPGPAEGGGLLNVIGSTAPPNNSGPTGSLNVCVTLGSPNTSMFFASAPAFTVTLPPSISTAGQKFYIAVYDASGRSYSLPFEGPAIVTGQTLQFSSSNSFSVVQGNGITFCAYGVASSPQQSPSPLPTGATGTIAAQLSNVTPEMKSAVATVNGTILPAAPIPASCGSACTVYFTVPAVSNVTVSVSTYASSDGSGYPLGMAPKGSLTVLASVTTVFPATLSAVIASIGVSLNPTSVTSGSFQAVTVCVKAKDASGNVISGNYVDITGSSSPFTETVIDPTGQTTVNRDQNGNAISPTSSSCAGITYSGIGTGPSNVRIAAGTIVGDASLSFSSGPAFATDFAYIGYPLQIFQSGQASPKAQIEVNPSVGYVSGGAMDPSGLVWVSNAVGNNSMTALRSDGTPMGTISDPTVSVLRLLTIDSNGLLYGTETNPSSNPGVDLYVMRPNLAASSEALVRYIYMPPGGITSAAVDTSGTIYVVQGQQILEFPPGTLSGQLTPTATDNRVRYTQVATDGQGDLFATDGASVYKWSAGTFGTSPQNVTLTYPAGVSGGIWSIAPLSNGSGCAEIYTVPFRTPVYHGVASWPASGGSSPVCPINTTGTVVNLIGPAP